MAAGHIPTPALSVLPGETGEKGELGPLLAACGSGIHALQSTLYCSQPSPLCRAGPVTPPQRGPCVLCSRANRNETGGSRNRNHHASCPFPKGGAENPVILLPRAVAPHLGCMSHTPRAPHLCWQVCPVVSSGCALGDPETVPLQEGGALGFQIPPDLGRGAALILRPFSSCSAPGSPCSCPLQANSGEATQARSACCTAGAAGMKSPPPEVLGPEALPGGPARPVLSQGGLGSQQPPAIILCQVCALL